VKGPVWGLYLIAPLDLERMHVHVLLHTNAFCSKAMLGVLTSNEMVRNGPGRFLEPRLAPSLLTSQERALLNYAFHQGIVTSSFDFLQGYVGGP